MINVKIKIKGLSKNVKILRIYLFLYLIKLVLKFIIMEIKLIYWII